jgi:gamma-glutamylputrescine oxidase
VGPQEFELTRSSYYEASVARPTASPPLTGRISADVCVVGGGYVGLSAALELAERGYSVALLEAQQVGWGASGRNGGQALVGFGFAGQEAIEVQLSAADARCAWEISVDAMALLRSRIDRHAIECDYVPGHLILAVNTRRARMLYAWVHRVTRAYGYPLRSIGHPEIGNWIASKRFHSAVFDPQSGHLHPLKYCLGMAAAARAAGVGIYEDSAVIRIERGDKPIVQTAAGEVACSFVVLAGNVYLNDYDKRVAPELMPRIMPVGTYIIATEPMDPARADALIRKRAAAHDNNLILDYFRLTADNRLLFGGGGLTTMTPANLRGADAAADAGVFRSWRICGALCVGRFRRYHHEPGARFGRLGSNIYYPARLFWPRPGDGGDGGQAGVRGPRRAGRTLRPAVAYQASSISGRQVVAHADAGAGHALLPAA